MTMKWDAKTIIALTGLVSALAGGAEMRLAVSRLEDRAQRLDERLVRIERDVRDERVSTYERRHE
jgi:predicted ATP-grasp superfamily ATP-dependent carboligase